MGTQIAAVIEEFVVVRRVGNGHVVLQVHDVLNRLGRTCAEVVMLPLSPSLVLVLVGLLVEGHGVHFLAAHNLLGPTIDAHVVVLVGGEA